MLLLHITILGNRNWQIHRETELEHQRQILLLTELRVMELYEPPLDLLARFPRIDAVSLEGDLRQGTKHVWAWLQVVDQQRRLTKGNGTWRATWISIGSFNAFVNVVGLPKLIDAVLWVAPRLRHPFHEGCALVGLAMHWLNHHL